MNYVPRPGIVRTSLCGMSVLIPSRTAADACKTIIPLSLLGSIIWAGIEKDSPVEEVLKIYRLFSKKPDEELTEKINAFCESMVQKGAALRKDETGLSS